jgi:hypothetical protein
VTDELLTWLTAQIDTDERVAQAATAGPWWHNPGKAWLGPEAFEKYDRSKGEEFVGYGDSPFSGCVAATGPASHAQSMADAEHVARQDPARTLRAVAAKRRILERHTPHGMGDCRVCTAPHWGVLVCNHCYGQAWPCPDVLDLVAEYDDQPGYQPEWGPQ